VDKITGTQWFCLLMTTVIMVGAIGVNWARRGKDDDEL
jgi:hypothetical protein